MIHAEALLIEYHKGAVLYDALYGKRKWFTKGLKGMVSPYNKFNTIHFIQKLQIWLEPSQKKKCKILTYARISENQEVKTSKL